MIESAQTQPRASGTLLETAGPEAAGRETVKRETAGPESPGAETAARTEEPEAAGDWQGLEERWELDTSEAEPVYLLKGRNGSRMRVSESAHRLLSLRRSGVSSEAIAEALEAAGQTITAEELENRYQELCERIGQIESQANDNPMGFWFRIPILPERVVVALASRLKGAFRPRHVVVSLGIIAAGVVLLALLPPPTDFSAAGFWTGYGFLLVSVLIHELGHASACAYYGARPSDIGATLYLIYPALYSDVSAAWRLPRLQRVVVDLGGAYFQLLVGAAYMAGYALSGWRPFRVGYLMILGSMVFSLNPIFRFDGYWVVADALGVTNLGRQPGRVMRHLVQRLRRRVVEPLPWSPGITSVLAVYSVLSFCVWGLFLWLMGPRIWRMVSVLPGKAQGYFAGDPEVTLGSLLMSLAMSALMIFILWRILRSMLFRPLGKVVDRVRRLWRDRSRPQEVSS